MEKEKHEEQSYYSYDMDTGETTCKTVFRDNGRIDRWEGINKPGYAHYVYKTGQDFADEKPSWFRPVGEDPNRIWNDYDGVLDDDGVPDDPEQVSVIDEEAASGSNIRENHDFREGREAMANDIIDRDGEQEAIFGEKVIAFTDTMAELCHKVRRELSNAADNMQDQSAASALQAIEEAMNSVLKLLNSEDGPRTLGARCRKQGQALMELEQVRFSR